MLEGPVSLVSIIRSPRTVNDLVILFFASKVSVLLERPENILRNKEAADPECIISGVGRFQWASEEYR